MTDQENEWDVSVEQARKVMAESERLMALFASSLSQREELEKTSGIDGEKLKRFFNGLPDDIKKKVDEDNSRFAQELAREQEAAGRETTPKKTVGNKKRNYA